MRQGTAFALTLVIVGLLALLPTLSRELRTEPTRLPNSQPLQVETQRSPRVLGGRELSAPDGADPRAAIGSASPGPPVPPPSAERQPTRRAVEGPGDAGDPARSGTVDPRYHIRWRSPGLCSANGPILQARQLLLNSFREAAYQGVVARVAPEVDDATFVTVAQVLVRVVRETVSRAAMQIGMPPLVVYATVQDLRRTACVHQSALAYYDGSLHVSADTDSKTLVDNLRHEIAHHALVSRGVQAPMWLQEGLAMFNAGETWWTSPQYGLLSWGLHYHHPFARMVNAFPHTESEAFATAVYFQSLVMVWAVMVTGGDQSVWRLVDDLADGKVAPDDAFAQGVQTADPRQQEKVWHDVVRQVVIGALGPGYRLDVD